MSLPKIQQPIHDVKVPSLNKTLKFRPFLVSEEKILLMAQQSGDTKDVVRSIQQVVSNCAQEPIDILSLTIFDLEYLFLKLRSISVNNIVEVSYRDIEDDTVYDFKVDLNEVDVTYQEEHSNKIKVNDNMSLIMRYPKVEMMDKMDRIQSEVDVFFEVLKYSIESIVAGDQIFKLSDYPEAEQEQFISDLDIKSFKQISQFFSTMPRLRHTIKYTNKKGTERELTLETLNDFFTLG